MPGRRKEPAKVIRMKGNSHLSKAYLEEREESEVNVNPKELIIPDGLNEEQSRLYFETYNYLAEYNLVTHLETGLLTRYVKAKYEYDKLSVMIEGISIDNDYFKALTARLKISDELRKCENDLGLNMFSRMKMAVPKPEVKEETAAERLFGDL